MLNKEDKQQKPLTIRQALGKAVSLLQKNDEIITNPLLESQVLLAHVLEVDRTTLLVHPERQLPASLWENYRQALKKRATGYPLQYLTGYQEFMSLDFLVSPQVLIPRGDTEVLVEKLLSYREERANSSRILHLVDVGTGSGAIAVSLAHYWPELQITAVDISPTALALARQNAQRHEVKIEFIQGDLLTPLLDSKREFDFIVSNPPYIPTQDLAKLPMDVRQEPVGALDGGEDGLDYYRRLLTQSQSLLVPGGILALEIGWDQGEGVRALMENKGYQMIEIGQDYAGRDRIIAGVKGKG